MGSYGRLLSSYPGAVVASVAFICITCLIVIFTVHTLPDFSDPQLGFECRGTILSNRATAWHNLLESTKWPGPLTQNPFEATVTRANLAKGTSSLKKKLKNMTAPKVHDDGANASIWGQIRTKILPKGGSKINLKTKKSIKSSQNQGQGTTPPMQKLNQWSSHNDLNHDHFEWGQPVNRSPAVPAHHKPVWDELELELEEKKRLQHRFDFCDQPHAEYAHLIVSPVRNESLWSAENIISICRLDEMLRSAPMFANLCQTNADSNSCCPSWTVGHYIAMIRNRTSCFDIDDQDVSYVFSVLQVCSRYYSTSKLTPHCDPIVREGASGSEDDSDCGDVPGICSRGNAVYHILHYLSDLEFMSRDDYNMRYSSIFLPTARSSALLPYFEWLSDSLLLANNGTKVVAIDFGLKEALFNEYMMRDTLFLVIGAVVVCTFMWCYTSSFFLTLMSTVAVLISLTVAFFVYTFVFALDFFPFMNLLAAVLIVGIGADDVFVYLQVWRCTKADEEGGAEAKLVSDALIHAGLSMWVTSVTTAAAFFSSLLCPVTAVRCFSLFAGLTVTIHFLLMLSWLPASVLLSEKYCSWPNSLVCSQLTKAAHYLSNITRVTFDKILPCIVIKFRYLWLVILIVLAGIACVVVFYYPKLRVANSREFQLFSDDHLFERYDLRFKNEFYFEKPLESMARMPLRFVWGILAQDNGRHLDPVSKGEPAWDPSFNVAKAESQQWLRNFCQDLKQQTFYQPTLGPLLSNCFIDTFISWMSRRCKDSVDGSNREPCCEASPFPYSEKVFNKCIIEAIQDLYSTPSTLFVPGVAGPRFNKTSLAIQAIVIEFESNVTFSLSYQEMDDFYNQVEAWMSLQLSTAPTSMSNGWFHSELSFYDVQRSLLGSTSLSIGIAMLIALIVLMASTWNIWLSLMSVLCLSCVVVVSIAMLVLLGWNLNVLESVCVTLAVGLSIDFSLHYAVGYRLSPVAERQAAVEYTLSRMSSPIAMAAATTFAAGAAVLLSTVVAYKQIGTFLVVVMFTSWLYSTFLLPSLLFVVAPPNMKAVLLRAGHCCHRASNSDMRRADKAVNGCTVSESTVSTWSVSNPKNENHELEPLTTSQRMSLTPALERLHGQQDHHHVALE